MKVDASKSVYHEADGATDEFNRVELRRARYLLRRLRFLEAQVRENGGMRDASGSGGAVHAEWEVEALEWALGPDGLDFLGPVGVREPETASQ